MYKIYINDNPLFLIAREDLADLQAQYPDCLPGRYSGQVKTLLHYIDLLEKASAPKVVVLYAENLQGLIDDFHSLHKFLEAAGGLVFNREGKALFIFRRGKWDLPKGKLDRGEMPPQAAIREVQEETGLHEVSILHDLCATFHTYREKGKRILKKTHWYAMQTPEQQLVPQAEEDIEKAVWVDMEAFLREDPDMYSSLWEVINAWLASSV
ncbi:MAG: NUDIX hydrolase [Saprospirales bacterium]|nr:NUDIX hydrolase [Saprospirales bacterium]MBK8490350.1 NUDIX hydrolase [Saprospirales bacterium]